MSKSKQREVKIVKVENGWETIDVKHNSKAGFCASLQTTVYTCNSCNWIILNIDYVMNELFNNDAK